MTYCISDFGCDDQHQYFVDTMVPFRTSTGETKVGQLTGLDTDDEVAVLECDGVAWQVPSSALIWKGLTRPRTLVRGHHLYYVGPAGIRHYKKPPTSRNVSALVHSSTAPMRFFGPDARHGAVSSEILRAYLQPAEYPADFDEASAFLRLNGNVVALSETLGLVYKQAADEPYFIRAGLCDLTPQISTYLALERYYDDKQ